MNAHRSGDSIAIEDAEDIAETVKRIYVAEREESEAADYASLYDGWRPTYEYKCSFCGNTFYRERLIKTNDKFCSRSCAGKYQQNKNKGGCPSG